MKNIPDYISLENWADYYGQFGRIVEKHESGCVYVIDNIDIGRRELWHLTDYLVSSVIGGTIWLIKRD